MVGELEISYDVFEMPGEAGLSIGAYSAEEATASADKLALLASWAADQEFTVPNRATAYFLTYRMCLGLQRGDRAVLAHGIETGVIKRLPHGEYIEMHQPLGPVDDHGHPVPLEYQGAPVPKKMNKLGSAGKPGPGSFLRPDPAPEAERLLTTEHTEERRQLAVLREYQLRRDGERHDR